MKGERVSVTDPELHLMLELLDDDPGDDSVVAASEALLARAYIPRLENRLAIHSESVSQ